MTATTVWGVVPVPVSVTPAVGSFSLAGTTMAAPGLATPVGEYAARLFGLHPSSVAAVRLRIVDGPDEEGYRLTITPEGLDLEAPSPAGLFHGVQTLRQLVQADGSVPAATIVDRPRFAYRGVMLDVARRFVPVAGVKRLIDLAALHKLNHLHLHLTDDQGWRIAVRGWPRLTTYGGGTEVGDGPGGYYSQDEYREIVAYAAAHYITVVPEVDLPGHSNAALASYPELTCDGQAPPRYRGIDVGFSSLCLENPLTYQFLDDVFGELAALTPGPYLHIGGDEAKTVPPDAYAAVIARAQDIVGGHGKTVIGWHEIAGAKLLPSTIVQYWGVAPESELARIHTTGAVDVSAAAAQGTRVIMSPADRAYLDMKYDEGSRLGLSWAGYVSVEASYDWDPTMYLSGVDEGNILGIEAPLWTETVRDVGDIEYLALPRLAVLAEIGWSTTSRRDWTALRARLAALSPLWTSLGVNFHRSPDVPWPQSL